MDYFDDRINHLGCTSCTVILEIWLKLDPKEKFIHIKKPAFKLALGLFELIYSSYKWCGLPDLNKQLINLLFNKLLS